MWLTDILCVPEILRLIVTDALNNNRFAVDCCKTKTGLNWLHIPIRLLCQLQTSVTKTKVIALLLSTLIWKRHYKEWINTSLSVDSVNLSILDASFLKIACYPSSPLFSFPTSVLPQIDPNSLAVAPAFFSGCIL